MKLAENILEDLWFAEDDRQAADDQASHSLAARLADIEGLKPFPEVARNILAVFNDPDFSVSDVVAGIREDPALAAKVLRVANSAIFARKSRCVSITDAVMRLGARTVTEVVVAVSLADMFDDVTGYGKSVRDHCSATAAIARMLVLDCQPKYSDGMFLSGLMHDVGKMLLMQAEEFDYTARENHEILEPECDHLYERRQLGFDHAVLGGHVLAMWQMPEKVQTVVAWHHQPGRAFAHSQEIGMMVGVLRLADHIDSAMQRPLGKGESLDQRIKALGRSSDADYARISADKLAAEWETLFHVRSDAVTLFS